MSHKDELEINAPNPLTKDTHICGTPTGPVLKYTGVGPFFTGSNKNKVAPEEGLHRLFSKYRTSDVNKPKGKKLFDLKTDYKSRLFVVDAIIGGCTPKPGTMTITLQRIGLYNNGMWKRDELMKLSRTDLQNIYISNRGKAIENS